MKRPHRFLIEMDSDGPESTVRYFYRAGNVQVSAFNREYRSAKPELHQWESFWRLCEFVEIWKWIPDYSLESPRGGTRWRVEIKFDKSKEIESTGVGTFPSFENVNQGVDTMDRFGLVLQCVDTELLGTLRRYVNQVGQPKQIDPRLLQLVVDYNAAVELAVLELCASGVPRPRNLVEWVGFNDHGNGILSNGGKYFIHGFGCAVHMPSVVVDFDFGVDGQINGFTHSRLASFAGSKLQERYGIGDSMELSQLVNEGVISGDIVCDENDLCYVKESLQRKSADAS